MGLAASQARLLTITARLADNELRSQTINNAKMRLATQSSQASENYINALNDATLKFANYDTTGVAQTQALSYNALTAYSSYNTQYGLVNSSGQLLVSEEEAALYEKSNEDLETYLQYHGLTYDTTYFDEIGNITNTGYPEEFSVLTVSDMKEIYKNYSSIENSQEVETFNNAYNEYISKRGSLENASKTIMKSYFTGTSGVTNKLILSGSSYTIDGISGSTLEDKLNAAKTALKDTAANPYSLKNLVNNGVMTEGDDKYKTYSNPAATNPDDYGILDAFKASGNQLIYTETQTITGTSSSGSVTYKIDNVEITVDSSGNITAQVSNTDGTQYPNANVSSTGSNTDIIDFINHMTYSDDNDTITYGNTTATNTANQYKVTSTTKSEITDGNEQDNMVKELVNEMIKTMLDDIGVDFAQALYKDANEPSDDNDTFITDVNKKTSNALSSNVSGTTKTLETFYKEYYNAESDYIKEIFTGNITDTSSSAYFVKDKLDSGVDVNDKSTYVYFDTGEVDANGNPVLDYLRENQNDTSSSARALTYEDLSDVDFLLRFMNANGLEMSESFKTVVKEFMMDNIIAEYGTPKYAWQDSTDTNNTGNADAKAQWYTNLFNRMRQGYKALENGLASSSEWIEYALESGIVTMEQVDSSYEWQGLDYKACAKITEETDDAAVTKAEAEYNRAMNDIESKDNIYDIELKNIDTEHSSLQTEYDSIKTVISKNVERTFNFYKNA